jgi:hypothetical protein
MRDNVIDCRIVGVGIVIWRKAKSKTYHLYRRDISRSHFCIRKWMGDILYSAALHGLPRYDRSRELVCCKRNLPPTVNE